MEHIVRGSGVSVSPEKFLAVQEWSAPRDKHELRNFLRLYTYYRIFVFGFANITKPLTKDNRRGPPLYLQRRL